MIESKKYKLSEGAKVYYNKLNEQVSKATYKYLVNPCGEIVLRASGGYCIISDIVPFHCDSLEEVIESAKLAARFLIRVNTMDSLYKEETSRTMRIGVSLTGIHEFAWKFFGLGFKQIIDSDYNKYFWNFIDKLRIEVENEAREYAAELGVNCPHTFTTIKPSGSVSKLFALTEGAHLPAMRYYLRWVMFDERDPMVRIYESKGYPTVPTKYPGSIRVGFPTVPTISTLGMGESLITADEATPEEQYKYLMLLEKNWLGEGNNQISYTMKFNKKKVSNDEFKKTLLEYQSQIRCCSVMPSLDLEEAAKKYDYLPEESISEARFIDIMKNINDPDLDQVIDVETLMCSSGACPL